MFKQWIRIILLALAIIALDNLNLINQFSSIAYASDDITPIVGGKANHPSCEGTGSFVAIIAGVTAALATLIAGYALFIAPEPISTATGAVMITSAMAALFSIVTAGAEFFACTHGFVRHPVLRWDNNGQYKKCKNPEDLFPGDPSSGKVCKSQEYEDESDYNWPENKAPYSDYIEVCYRYPLIPFPIFNVGNLSDREYEFGLKGDFTQQEVDDGKSDDIIRMKEWIGDPGGPDCAILKAGELKAIHGISFKAYEDGGRICVDAVGMFGGEYFLGAPVIGCHARAPSPPAPMCEKSIAIEFDDNGKPIKYDNTKCFSCYISGACYSQVSLAARAVSPITSVVIQCIRESLSHLITGDCSIASGQTSSGEGLLGIVQERLKDTVKAVLVLAVALFGIKMMMGTAIQGPHEYFMLLLKFALVIYFSIAGGMQVYYDQLITLSVGLSDLVLSAGGSDQVCNYDTADYIRDLGNGVKDYSYLAPWDRLDCRIGFYLGNGFAIGGAAASGAAVVAAATGGPLFGVLLLIIPALFAGQILIAICVAFFIFMLILTVIWIVHLFILSLIALTVVSLFAPIFVPMVLFQATKGFFDGWLRQLMAYSIYPIILFAFLALVFSVYDKMYFDDLTFTSHSVNKDIGNNQTRLVETFIPNYAQCDANPSIIACVISQQKFVSGPLMLGIDAIKADISDDTKKIWQGFAMMGLIGFLFYHFLGVVGSMAAELSGSFRANLSQHASGPKQMAGKIEAGAMKTANLIGGGIKSAASKAGGGKGGDGGGKEEMSSSTPRGGAGGA